MTCRRLVLPLALSVLCGCLSSHRYAQVVRYPLNPMIEVTKVETSNRTLGMRMLEAARPYKEKIAYIRDGQMIDLYPQTQWAEFPADTVTRALADAIRATGRFRDVGDAGDLATPDLILTGSLRKFDVVETAGNWEAFCEVRLELRTSLGRDAVWAATLSAREAYKENDLPNAMARAIAKVVNAAANQIAGH